METTITAKAVAGKGARRVVTRRETHGACAHGKRRKMTVPSAVPSENDVPDAVINIGNTEAGDVEFAEGNSRVLLWLDKMCFIRLGVMPASPRLAWYILVVLGLVDGERVCKRCERSMRLLRTSSGRAAGSGGIWCRCEKFSGKRRYGFGSIMYYTKLPAATTKALAQFRNIDKCYQDDGGMLCWKKYSDGHVSDAECAPFQTRTGV